MIANRSTELEYLENYYRKQQNQMVVVYGQKNIGISTLIQEFRKNKPGICLKTSVSTEREQQYLWGKELRQCGMTLDEYPTFSHIFHTICRSNRGNKEKIVLVIEDFGNMVKTGTSFMTDLVSVLQQKEDVQDVLIILCSSSVGWVENSMVPKIGKQALLISGFLKVRELSFYDFRTRFSHWTVEECMRGYSILGGIPGLWDYFDDSLKVEENVIKHILNEKSFLHEEGHRILSEELRELSVYATILECIASGKHKLNEIYEHTGFSRAKISVYLKNLMELEVVEKMFSYESGGKEHTMKGMYRIKQHFIHFWSRYLYGVGNAISQMSERTFYEERVKADLEVFYQRYFSKICLQYMEKEQGEGRLPIQFVKEGEWIGKQGMIPMILESTEGKKILGYCHYNSQKMTLEDFEWFLFCEEKAKIKGDFYFLFSSNGFEDRLMATGNQMGNVTFLTANELCQ